MRKLILSSGLTLIALTTVNATNADSKYSLKENKEVIKNPGGSGGKVDTQDLQLMQDAIKKLEVIEKDSSRATLDGESQDASHEDEIDVLAW